MAFPAKGAQNSCNSNSFLYGSFVNYQKIAPARGASQDDFESIDLRTSSEFILIY